MYMIIDDSYCVEFCVVGESLSNKTVGTYHKSAQVAESEERVGCEMAFGFTKLMKLMSF